MNSKPSRLLNPSQAQAAYSAMCELNNVSLSTLSARFPSGEAGHDLEVRVGKLGGVGVYRTDGSDFEVYAGQHEFAVAYDLA